MEEPKISEEKNRDWKYVSFHDKEVEILTMGYTADRIRGLLVGESDSSLILSDAIVTYYYGGHYNARSDSCQIAKDKIIAVYTLPKNQPKV